MTLAYFIFTFLAELILNLMHSLNPGESIGATQSNRKQDSGSWTKNGLGVLYTSAWFFLHGF